MASRVEFPLTPYDVVPGSEKEVYWACSEGHVWKAAICSRTNPRESRCPICHPRTVTRCGPMRPMDPALVQIWHPTKNLPVMPSEIACQSNKKFWWKCEKGHEWQCDPSHLNKLVPLKRCPYCNDRAVCGDNSLLARYPELAREWDHKLNFPLTPDQVLYCSGKKYWWRRGEFVWQASIKDRQRKGRDSPWPIPQVLPAPAPVCDSSGARRPVGRLKNALLTPDQVSAQSGRKIWWQCEKGHVWQSTINKRIRGDGCPYCSGHRPSKEYCLQTCYPAIAAQWHPERNKGLTPRDVTLGSGRNVWWQCEKGHEWKASVSNRSRRGHNCPYCADRSKRLGSVAEARPDLLGEWNYGKNTKTPQDCSARSNKKYGGNAASAAMRGKHPRQQVLRKRLSRLRKKRRGSEGRLGGSPIPL